MQQVPDFYKAIPINEEDENFLPLQNESSLKKWFAIIHAFLPKFGDFSTNYFNYLKIIEITRLCIEPLQDVDVYPEVATACYIFAVYFAINSLLNDLLLYIPAEEYQNIYDYLLEEKAQPESLEEKRNCSVLGAIARPLSYTPLYSAFAILSANGAVGTLAVFPSSLFAKICGSILALLSTELGIFYSHMVFHPRIKKFIKLINDGYENFHDVGKFILSNPSLVAQIIKYFGIISCYYTVIGIFYLYSLVEQLSVDFAFPISDRALNIAMGISGFLIFITNMTIRFPATLEKHFSSIASAQESKLDILQELLLTGAGLTLSIRRLPSYSAILGVVSSITSLAIGLRSISLRANNETALPANTYTYSFIPNWLNGHSRLLKSTILPFAAIGKVIQMLKTHGGFSFKFDLVDTLCATIIFAIPIGVNSSKMYKKSIQVHLNYLREKIAIERQRPEGLFGKFYCLFIPSKAYPQQYREILCATLKA